MSENRLIEDADGAPLPAELQPDSQVWDAIYRAMNDFDGTEVSVDECVDKIAVELAPVLWPWLPSNDHSPAGDRERLIRIAVHDPGRFTARHDFAEPLHRWQVRAVLLVLNDPDRARAAL